MLSNHAAGVHTRQEILSQPAAWSAALEVLRAQAEALREFIRGTQADSILLTGCGSTYYVAVAAAAALQELTGLPARGLPASEIWLYPQAAYARAARPLLVAISRSGATTETVRACQAFQAQTGGPVLTLTCYPQRALNALGALNLVLPSGQETSIAQTRAFTTLYLGTLYLAAVWAGREAILAELARLPALGQSLLADCRARVAALAGDAALDRFYFLGSGARYGLACELNLKLKEMSLSHCEAFHFMEFRHGPKAMVTASTLIVGLVSTANRERELAVLDDLRAMGAHLLAIGEAEAGVAFHSGLSELARGPLYLPAGQWLAVERSLHQGLNPDKPHHLDAVVVLS